jgi:enterochelin esterase-like enzyme
VAARVEDAGATLSVPDANGRWESVTLAYHLRPPYPDLSFARTDHGWTYWLPRPDVDRVEYLIECRDRAGDTTRTVDETNPRRVPGVFGQASVLEFPGYLEPDWLSWQAPTGERAAMSLPHGRGLRRDLPLELFSPDGLAEDEAAPLLLVHDGPEMDRFAALTQYCAAMVAAGVLRPHRVGLLEPRDRDAWYSASPAYARSLAHHAVPAILDSVPTIGRPVLAGASLGALAALHAEWTSPGTFAGLFLASGSFFQMRYDSHEQHVGRFFRISSAVERILDAPAAPSNIPIAMVCGTGEENWENNQAMAAALRRVGRPVDVVAFRDGHTWVGWRDALHPTLTGLLARLWDGSGEH